MANPILITNFNGQAENPHIGSGVNVGVDLYTTKNVARLSRKMEKKSGSLADALPLFSTQDNSNNIYVQLENGKILKSTDQGLNWTLLAGNTGASGKGLVVWQDYLWAFFGTGADLYGPLSGSPAWINSWTGFSGGNALINSGNVNHMAFPNPAVNAVMYVNNKNYIAQVKIITFPFVPGTPATYEVIAQKFKMQDYYIAKCLGFLPASNIAIGVENSLNNSRADIVIWDGSSDVSATNVFTIPGASGPVTNLLTRNGVMYAVTTNEAGIYTVNGTAGQMVDRLGLRMTNRTSGGKQYTTRVQPVVGVGATDFLGPELLVGICNFPSPVTQISGSGLYPYGVWSTNVENNITYTKFPLSHGSINANYDATHEIGFVKVISNGAVLVGWSRSSTYGIDLLNSANYISDKDTTFIESELYEVGTRVKPETFSNMYYNLAEQLKAGEEISFYYRKSPAEDYTLFWTDTSTTLGTNLGGIINPLPFQEAKFIQIGVRLKAGSGTPNETPQVVSIYLNK